MKCSSCGGALARPTLPCPFCSSRPEIDLRTVNHHDLGPAPGMACPRCRSALEIRRLTLTPTAAPLDVERCLTCHGIFFNPGELERFLEIEVASTVWLDTASMDTLSAEALTAPRERGYIPCPTCGEIMNSLNFGGKSGVLIDRCRAHGFWLDGGELRQIARWWHAGGKHTHQANETQKATALQAGSWRRAESPTAAASDGSLGHHLAAYTLVDALGALCDSFFD